jgi:glycosyltransferase involved in cell wall biosynthesis
VPTPQRAVDRHALRSLHFTSRCKGFTHAAFNAASAERLSFSAFDRTDGLPNDYESSTSPTLPFYFQQQICEPIDLCVRDIVRFTRFANTTFVLGPAIPDPYPEVDYHALRFSRDGRSYELSQLREVVETLGCDVVVVQQHMRTAISVAKALAERPVIVHRHSFEKENQSRIKGYIIGRRYASLAGTLVVSDALRAALASRWPDVAEKFITAHNGLDFSQWRPARTRRREILWVGRAVQEKGCIEAALGVTSALAKAPEWRARFIFSNVHEQPAVFRRARAILQGMPDRIDIEVNRPFDLVKEANEHAEIAVCPSIWQEPFGRTALEAHAGGAALISSGRGGLREVSGAHAAFIEEVTAGAIEAAILRLVRSDPLRRALQVEGRRYAKARFDMSEVSPRYDEALVDLTETWSPKRGAADVALGGTAG